MSALVSGQYGSDSEEDVPPQDPQDVFNLTSLPSAKLATEAAVSSTASQQAAAGSSNKVQSAPDVLDKDIMAGGSWSHALTRPTDTQMNVNLPYDALSHDVQGPRALTDFNGAGLVNRTQNTVTGWVDEHAMSEDDFRQQQKSFNVLGYARNPEAMAQTTAAQYVGNSEKALQQQGQIEAEFKAKKAQTKALKRKREDKGKLGVFNNPEEEEEDQQQPKEKEYKGPWATYEEEDFIPDGPDWEEEEEHFKRTKTAAIIVRGKRDVGFGQEKSVFHGKQLRDYQGRSYMAPPREDVPVNLETHDAGSQECYIPKRCIHTWSGHTRGISSFELFPKTGHLLLSASMDSRIKLWDVYREGKCLRTFMGHGKAVRDVNFSPDGTQFLSAGFDRQMKLWDTESGACVQAFSNGRVPYCIKFNPGNPNIFLAGMHDKKIIQYDIRSGEITQEYDQHLGPVNTITFTDEGRRFVTTSDDKTIRAWDFDIPVVIKYIAEPSMHSMPAMTLSPNKKWLAAQSLDNQILIYSAETYKQNRKKRFAGHTVAGYACVPSFSPDGRFVSSGDAEGSVHFWDFKTGKKYPNRLRAHQKCVIDQKWLPHETSKLVTASWDGLLKLWS